MNFVVIPCPNTVRTDRFVPATRRNHYWVGPAPPRMVEFGPTFYILAGAVLLFVFFLFLFIRRTFTGFKEGMDEGKR